MCDAALKAATGPAVLVRSNTAATGLTMHRKDACGKYFRSSIKEFGKLEGIQPWGQKGHYLIQKRGSMMPGLDRLHARVDDRGQKGHNWALVADPVTCMKTRRYATN